MEEAIKKAIEGGYRGYLVHTDIPLLSDMDIDRTVDGFNKYKEVHLLNPLFWQSLGKTEGWSLHKGPCDCDECRIYRKHWNLYMHRFIDHLIEGNPTDDFFKELLK